MNVQIKTLGSFNGNPQMSQVEDDVGFRAKSRLILRAVRRAISSSSKCRACPDSRRQDRQLFRVAQNRKIEQHQGGIVGGLAERLVQTKSTSIARGALSNDCFWDMT